MKVRVRFRDIPLEEARKCYQKPEALTSEGWERMKKNNDLFIDTPASPILPLGFACAGPFFRASGEHGRYVSSSHGIIAVCPHLAEIGD